MPTGDAAAVPCATCGGGNSAVARFCQHCGSPLEPPATERRKVVTVVFCDVTDSTALGERLDPEVLRGLMGRFYDAARTVVLRHEGSVEKFIGDAVVAVFGVPVSREDDALRAVRVAAEIQDAVGMLASEVHERYGVDLAVRTGVNTGEVVVGEPRAGGSFATGDAVNTAARLEQAAGPGETLLGEATYQLVRDAVMAEALEPLALRGKQGDMAAYRLRSVGTAPGRRSDTPFVGRVRERSLLDDAFARAVESQTASLVTVLGDAGLGKSRLVGEFVSSLADSATVLRGRCLSYGDGITFWPVVELLRGAMALVGSEPDALVTERLMAMVDDGPDARAVVAQLGPLLGTGGEPGSIDDVTWAVQSVVERLAETRPVVLDIDDVQWAEPVLLDLVEGLLRWCRDLPLMVVCQARPEFLAGRPAWGGGVANVTTVRLEPLPDSDAATMVAQLTGAEAHAIDQILSAAGGNPLFLEQLVAHVRNAPEAPGPLRVPPTLAALLAARLDQLDDVERDTLAAASVVGQVFHVAEVVALSEKLADADVSRALERLSDRQIVRRSRQDGRGAYRFRHMLVQEAAYDAQPKRHRAHLHRRYAGWLRDNPGEAAGELDAIVGWHLEQAHLLLCEVSPGDPGNEDIARDAADALVAAARTRVSADLRSAAALLERAAALTGSPQLKARRLLEVAHLHWAEISPEAAAAALDQVDELGPVVGPAATALAATTRLALATATSLDADAHRAIEVARATYEAAEREHWPWGQALARRFEANAHNVLGEWRQMGPLVEESVALAEAAGDTHLRDESLMYGFAVARWGPTPVQEALAMSERVLEAVADAPVTRRRAEYQCAALRAMDGDIDGARAAIGPGTDEGLAHTFWAFCAVTIEVVAGNDLRAAEFGLAGADAARARGDVGYSSTLYGLAGAILADVGDSRAAQVMATARDSTPAGDAVSQCLWRLAAALLAASDGDASETRRLVEESIEWMDRSDQINEQADVRRRAANAMARIGDGAAAKRLLEEALDRYRAKGNLPLAARCEEDLAALA